MTLAHAAVVPPMMRASRGRLVLSALVVGSMAPDFESLAYLSSHRTLGHTVPGLFVFCLPVTLAVLAVWHGLVKRPLAELLPPRLAPVAAVAAEPFSFTPASRFLAICVSALAASVTHLVWDGFTHEGAFLVERIRFLRQPVHWHGLQVLDVLQYGSGLLGLVMLGVWWHRWTERQARAAGTIRTAGPRLGRPAGLPQHGGAPAPRPAGSPVVTAASPRIRRTALSVIALITASGGAANALRGVVDGLRAREVLAHGAYGAMAGWVLAVLLVSAFQSWRRDRA